MTEFIAEHADAFPNLQVAYPSGQKPRLVMMDEDDVEKEVISITGWNVESIKDYLKENLKDT